MRPFRICLNVYQNDHINTRQVAVTAKLYKCLKLSLFFCIKVEAFLKQSWSIITSTSCTFHGIRVTVIVMSAPTFGSCVWLRFKNPSGDSRHTDV